MNLPGGERIISDSITDLESVYKKLPEDFRGVIRLLMKFEDKEHRGDILIDCGNILCVSLFDPDGSISSYGDKALEEIKDKAHQSVGNVDVYRFSESEMPVAIDSNDKMLFRPAVPLDRLLTENLVVDEESVEEWEAALGKLDDEWANLEEEWKKLDSIKVFSRSPEERRKAKSADDDAKILNSKPKLLRCIGFTDRLRFRKFPNLSGVTKLMDGKKTVDEIANELKMDKKVITNLTKELKGRGYID
jgi:hypothetical protein